MATAKTTPPDTTGADVLSDNARDRRAVTSQLTSAITYPSHSFSWLHILFGLLALCMPLVYWPFALDAAGVPRQALLALGAGTGILLFAVQVFRTGKPIAWHPLQLLMLLFLIWAIASLYWSVDWGMSLLGTTQLVSLVLLALLATQLSGEGIQRYLLPLALVSASLVAVIGIGQHFDINPLSLRQSSRPPASTFLNRNYAANYLDLLVPVALVILLSQPRPTRPLALLAATAFASGMAFLILAQSRGSWLGLLVAAVALIVACAVNPDLRRLLLDAVRRHHYALVISFIVIVSLSFTSSRVLSEQSLKQKVETITSFTPDHSIQTRLDTYLNTAAGFLDHPWRGIGYGAFVTGFSPYVAAVRPVEIINKNYIMPYAHSDPLQMFFELGLPGGLLCIAIYLLVILMAWKIASSTAPVSQRLTGLGLMLALLASGTHATVDFPLQLPTSAFFFWVWIGLVIGLYMQTRSYRQANISRTIWVVTGICGLLFTFHTANLYYKYLRANSDVLTAKLRALKRDCEGSLKATDRAMAEFGLDHLSRFWYVKAYSYCSENSNDQLRAMDRALAYDPNMALAHLTRARIQLADNYLVGAARDFDQYRKLLPHKPEGYSGLGLIAIRLKNWEQAKYWLEKALTRAPEDQELQRLYKLAVENEKLKK
jgi:O-antigen ligase